MNIYICAIIVAICLTSCEEFIDIDPLDRISNEDYWRNTNDLENYLRQFYSMLSAPAETDSDHVISGIRLSEILNGERVPVSGNWISEWSRVRHINLFFDNYSKVEDDFEAYSQYLGEAYFFRSWIYYNLVTRYGDLPWYSSAIEIDEEDLYNKPRDTRTTVVDSILNDLDNAILYLDKRASTGNNRINKEVALAFKSRVALYEGSWQKYHKNTPFGTEGANPDKYFRICIEACDELINGDYWTGIYDTGNPTEDYYRLFGFDDMTEINEVLLYKAFNASEGLSNIKQSQVTYRTDDKGATWNMICSYLGRDGLPYDFNAIGLEYKGNAFLSKIANDCDLRLQSSIWMPGDLMAQSLSRYFERPAILGSAGFLCPTGFQIKKGANPQSPGAGFDFDRGSETGLIIFRYGEVLLNYAEALWEAEGVVAYDELNILRQRSGMPSFQVHDIIGAELSKYGYVISPELYEIRRERSVELALEGFRDDDLMRWAAHQLFQNQRPRGYPVSMEEFPDYPQDKIDEHGLIDFYKLELPIGYRFRADQDYLYPIPQDELSLNPNLDQNPGW